MCSADSHSPTISIEPLDATLPDMSKFDLLCVTSPNGAQRLLEIAPDARALAGPTIAAIGPGTARALRAGGIAADIVPERAIAESLVEALAGVPVARALIARAEEARDLLPDALRARGAQVEILALYRTIAGPLDEAARAAALGADYVTFSSASAVRFFVEAAGKPDGARLVSIGPVTSDALREHGLEPEVEAGEHRYQPAPRAVCHPHAFEFDRRHRRNDAPDAFDVTPGSSQIALTLQSCKV